MKKTYYPKKKISVKKKKSLYIQQGNDSSDIDDSLDDELQHALVMEEKEKFLLMVDDSIK